MMQHKLLFFLFFLFSSQPVFCISLNSQSEIDNFSIDNPDSIDIDFLIITGADIVDLNGLSQLKSVNRFVRIYLTSISNLEGLQNIEYMGREISFSANNFLTSLNAIENAEFSQNVSIRIDFNPSLQNCNIESFCGALSSYNFVYIIDNGIGCDSPLDIRSFCGLDGAMSHEEICFEDGFENWDGDQLLNWEIDIPNNYANGLPNYEIAPSIDEGDHSLLIRNEILKYRFLNPVDSFNISWTFNSQDSGSLYLAIEEVNLEISDTSGRNVLLINNLDNPNNQNLFLSSIQPSGPNYKILSVSFRIYPFLVENPFGSPFLYYPTIHLDNVVISKGGVSGIQNIPDNYFKAYPNPFNDVIVFDDPDNTLRQIELYNFQGERLVSEASGDMIYVDHLESGNYFIKLISRKGEIIQKLIKI